MYIAVTKQNHPTHITEHHTPRSTNEGEQSSIELVKGFYEGMKSSYAQSLLQIAEVFFCTGDRAARADCRLGVKHPGL